VKTGIYVTEDKTYKTAMKSSRGVGESGRPKETLLIIESDVYNGYNVLISP